MPTQIRQKKTGALIFHQTPDEKQAVKDRHKIQELEAKLKKLEGFIDNIKENNHENKDISNI